MERRRVDFHVHYKPSDPIKSGQEMIDIAAASNVVAIGLLARNQVVDQLDELQEYGEQKGVVVVTGVEAAVMIMDRPAELICLGFDYKTNNIQDCFNNNKENQEVASLQRQYLESRGFDFSCIDGEDKEILDGVMLGKVAEKAITLCDILARSSMENRSMIENLASNNPELWDQVVDTISKTPNYRGRPDKLGGKFLYKLLFDFGKDGFKFVRENITFKPPNAEEVIKIVHESGGVVLYSPEGYYDVEVWNRLQHIGIDGIMGWHGRKLCEEKRDDNGNLKDTPREVICDAVRKGMLILGGSDAQGKDWAVGRGNGEMFISTKKLDELVYRLNKQQPF